MESKSTEVRYCYLSDDIVLVHCHRKITMIPMLFTPIPLEEKSYVMEFQDGSNSRFNHSDNEVFKDLIKHTHLLGVL